MKRKFANRPAWARITKRRYSQTYVKDNSFRGDIALLCLDQVREPLTVTYDGHETCIAANGFSWMQHFPENANHSLTTIFDPNDKIVQFYFDITKTTGRTEEGIPYFDDLFLDIVLIPGRPAFVLDEDELEEALEQTVINKTDYNLAIAETDKIVHSIETGTNVLINKALPHYETMKQSLLSNNG